MTMQTDSTRISLLFKLHDATASWWAQILFYLVLLVVLSVIYQPIVYLYRHFFQSGNSVFGWYLLSGTLIPVLSNTIVIVVSIRGRTFLAYLILTAILTYVLAIAYFFLTGLNAIYTHPMDGPGFVIFWMIAWFCGVVVGVFVKYLFWKYGFKIGQV